VSYLPVGSELSIITFGKTADINLPPTVVTDTNREGLHGRIPRKVLETDSIACTYCALNASLSALQNFMGTLDTGSVILITGSSERVVNLESILKVIDRVPIQVFPVLYPGKAHPDVFNLASHGKVFAVPEGEGVSPSGQFCHSSFSWWFLGAINSEQTALVFSPSLSIILGSENA
jgi:hypothetical protein